MKRMVIESRNVGIPKKEQFDGRKILTGICKSPVPGPLNLRKNGFEGDGVGDLKHHGGPDKAVCVYSLDHYPYWETILGTELTPPAFGENLSVSNLFEEDVCIGDVFGLGTALLQISQPRQPCNTLAARHGRKDLVRLVVDSGRTGFYFRVLEEGVVDKSSILVLRQRDPLGITVSFANLVYHHDKTNCEAIRKVLAVPSLSESWQRSFNGLLQRCGKANP
jgi:MOSC domain-containing protein YiiM